MRRDSDGTRRVNTVFASLLMLIVLLAPLPVGSNRGAAWMLWALLIAACAIAYGLAVFFGGGRLRPHALPRSVWWLLGCFILFALLQAAPLAALLPAWVLPLPFTGTAPPGGISLVPAASLAATLRFASMAVFLQLMLAVSGSRRRALPMAWVLFFAVLVYAIWAILSLRYWGDTFFWGEKTSSLGSATGPFINRNSFATFLGMGAVLGLALALGQLQALRQGGRHSHALLGAKGLAVALSLICTALIVVVQIATQSRMGVASTLVALALVWVLSHPPGKPRTALWLSLFAGVLIAAAMVLTQGADLVDRLIVSDSDYGTRQALYRQVWQMILDRPLVGYGLDSFPVAYELFHRPPVSAGLVWDNAHSSYLTLWVEMGLVIGSLPPLAALLIGLRLVRSLASQRDDRALGVAAIGCLVLVALHATLDFSIEMQANQMLALTILALGSRREV